MHTLRYQGPVADKLAVPQCLSLLALETSRKERESGTCLCPPSSAVSQGLVLVVLVVLVVPGDPRQQMTYKYLDYVVLTEFIQCSSPPAKDSSTWLLTAFGRGCSRG